MNHYSLQLRFLCYAVQRVMVTRPLRDMSVYWHFEMLDTGVI